MTSNKKPLFDACDFCGKTKTFWGGLRLYRCADCGTVLCDACLGRGEKIVKGFFGRNKTVYFNTCLRCDSERIKLVTEIHGFLE